jgi:tryptophan synthase alpha chain
MSRIAGRFAAIRAEARGALIPFIEASDPDAETSLALLRGLPAAGADLIEIGVPFTDPMADGPTIQRAGQRALKAGATLARTLGMVRAFRQQDDATPIVLMGYANPVLSYGVDRFCADAAASGVDGLIVVDLPPEEADVLAGPARTNGLDVIRLIAPTTDEARLPLVLEGTSGFLYHVAIAGITGTRSARASDLAGNVARIRRRTELPVAIGFGIKTPEQAAEAVRIADAAVVASALIETLASHLDAEGRATPGLVPAVLGQVAALASAVRAARRA